MHNDAMMQPRDPTTMSTAELQAELKRLLLGHADRAAWQAIYDELRERLEFERAKQRDH